MLYQRYLTAWLMYNDFGQSSSCNDSIYMMAIIILPCTDCSSQLNYEPKHGGTLLKNGCPTWIQKPSLVCMLVNAKKSFRLWLDEVLQGSAPFTCCFPCWGVATWTRHIFVRKKYKSKSCNRVLSSSDYTIFGSGKKSH